MGNSGYYINAFRHVNVYNWICKYIDYNNGRCGDSGDKGDGYQGGVLSCFGPGGQHRNTTDSAVRFAICPGIVVQATENRSQWQNREAAMLRLRKALIKREHKEKQRIATEVPRKTKQQRLPTKRSFHCGRRNDLFVMIKWKFCFT